MKSTHEMPQQRGFSLVEVMVSMVVIAAGLLGVAKMQALALANTSVASMRSLAAIEAASLASVMHENRGYWISDLPIVAPITIAATGSGSTPSISDATLSQTQDCTTATGKTPCSPSALAAYDVQDWARSAQTVLPNFSATVTCVNTTPPSCTIAITWAERAVALNTQEAQAQATAGAAYLQAPTAYTLYVEP
jgi:type IV pilus assembly protein PilV